MIILSLVIISIPCGGLANQELKSYFSGTDGTSIYINSGAASLDKVIVHIRNFEDVFQIKVNGSLENAVYTNSYDQNTETYLNVLNNIAFIFFPWNGIGQYFSVNIINNMLIYQTTSVIDTNVVPPFTMIDTTVPGWDEIEGMYSAWRIPSPNMFATYMYQRPGVNNLRLIMFIVYPLIHIFFYNVVAFADKLHKKFRRI